MAILSRQSFTEQYEAARQQGMTRDEAVNYLAQAAVAAQPYNKQNTQTSQASNTWLPRTGNSSGTNNSNGWQANWQRPTEQAVYDSNAALKNLQNIAATTTDKQLAKMINRYTKGDAKKDNFWGQTAASYGSGKINELLNQAWGKYADSGSDDDRAIADAYSQLAEYYQNLNAEALDDKNRKARCCNPFTFLG